MRHRSVPIARRNVVADGKRAVTGVLGVGASIALILLLQGLWSGVQAQISAYPRNAGAQLFVGDLGTRTTSESSVVPLSAVDRIRSLDGVTAADPIFLRSTIVTLHERKILTVLVGYEPGGLGGPWKIVAGRDVAGNDEVVLDRLLATQHDLEVGAPLDVMGATLRIVGLSDDTRTWMSAYAFISRGTAERIFRTSGTASFILVGTERPDAVGARIGTQLELTALPIAVLARNDRELFAGIMRGPLDLMILIAFAAGTLIVALTVYSQIVERSREVGIIKAMGARGTRLLVIVLGQTLALTLLGLAVGFLLFAGGSRLVRAMRPQFWVTLTVSQILFVAGAAAVMAMLAAILPTVRIARMDPASAYRGGAS